MIQLIAGGLMLVGVFTATMDESIKNFFLLDNLALQRITIELLDNTIKFTENGKEAIDILQQQHFDIILMDCMMPEMNGYEATQYIRKLDTNKASIPIIAMTADTHLRKQCIENGMNDMLSKPVDQQMLDQILKRLLVA
jgi:CheY-like chemotaxis protein